MTDCISSILDCIWTIDRVGEHFNIPTLTEFVANWLSLFSHSYK